MTDDRDIVANGHDDDERRLRDIGDDDNLDEDDKDFEDDDDFDEGASGALSIASIVTTEARALASIVLAAVSLLTIPAGSVIQFALAVNHHSFHIFAAIPAAQLAVAVLALLLGLSAAIGVDDRVARWSAPVARAAVIIAATSFVLNAVALGFALSTNDPGGPTFG